MADRDPVHEPHPDRLSTTHPQRPAIIAAHEAAMIAGAPGYTDPDTGSFVFTAAELVAKGPCCDSGCRHCPYV